MKSILNNTLSLILYIAPIFLFLLLMSSNSRYKNQISMLKAQNILIKNKTDYLTRCSQNQIFINKQGLNIETGNNFIIYFAGSACSSCLESLILLLNNIYNLSNIVTVIDEISKAESIISLNDGFGFSFSFIQIENVLPHNNILLFKLNRGHLLQVLEYSPAQENLFIEYFNEFYIIQENQLEL